MQAQDVAGYIVPRGDEYLGEYVPPSAERLRFLTGFTGSAGCALITLDTTLFLTDGRYTQQAKAQLDTDSFAPGDSTDTDIAAWFMKNAGGGAVGFDPALHSAAQLETWEKAGLSLKPLATNLIDEIWDERPSFAASDVIPFPEDVAGKSAAEKIAEIAEIVKEKGASACVLAIPESVAWLLNIRAHDLPHLPVALSRAVLHADGRLDWFIEEARLTAEINLPDSVTLHQPDALEAQLRALSGPVLFDKTRSSASLFLPLVEEGIKIIEGDDPCLEPRACKTRAEQDAMRDAHIKDGMAMVRFFAWLEATAASGAETELSLEEKLLAFRREDPAFRATSFDPIVGWQDHGAIIHYRATEDTAHTIAPPGLLLLDSGGQYEWGTTDITRTLSLGRPTDAQREAYTSVLKAHIALASARFPKGTNGAQLDGIVRAPLWESGYEFDHGTGHGVGVYLSVHEESASISKRGTRDLKPGMILSNEPGFYQAGAFGIRIENLILVHETGEKRADRADVPFYALETLTLVPFDRKLIVKDDLSLDERTWIDSYHAVVQDAIGPLLKDENERVWLAAATAAL